MIAQSVAEIVSRHVKLTLEGIDRIYLNVYVPRLQYEQGIVGFFRAHRGQPLPSAALMSPMTRDFVMKLEDFAARHGIPLVPFCKGQRKDDVMAEHLRRFKRQEGIVFVGKAQENTPVFRTERRRSPKTGRAYPWIVRRSAMVNNLHLCRRPGLRAVLPQVLQLLSLQCQAVPERPRICQAPTRTRRHRLRGARQWHSQMRRSQAPAGDLQPPFRRQDRCSAAQVAQASAASLHRGGP